jgi:putative MATE family efflux protein
MNRSLRDDQNPAPPGAIGQAAALQARAEDAAAKPRELGGRLAGLSLKRQVFVLAIWPLMEQVLNYLVGLNDQILAGHMSVAATNGVGVGVYVEWLIAVVQMAVGVGSSALVARAMGARHRRLANAALGQSLLLGFGCGIGIGALIYVIAPALGRFTLLEGESLDACVTYLRILTLAAPLSGVLFAGAACLRGSGDTRTPFVVLVLVNLVNSGMSILLVHGPAPIGGHGVAGIAGGTLCAWVVGSALMVAALFSGWGGLKLRLHRLRPHAHTMKRIVRVGVPNLAEALFGNWVANFVLMRVVGMLGNPAAWGAHVNTVKIEGLSYLPALAIAVAASTLTGQYLGLGDPERAKRAIRICWAAAVIVAGCVGLIFIAFPWPLARMLTDEPEILALTPKLLRIAGCFEIFLATYMVLAQALRGAGDTRATMVLMFISTFAVRLPLAYAIGVWMGYGLVGVWVGMCLELIVRAGLLAWRFRQGGWVHARV